MNVLFERAGVDEAARLRARDEADSDDDDGGDWIRSEQGRKRVIQVRFNMSVPRARVPEKASTRRERSEG